jgi:hypothetical protein
MFKVLLTALISLSLILCGKVAMAQEKGQSINTVEKLNSRILKLQQQIIEMQKRHDAEMASLRKEIEELAAKVTRQKKEEDLAALRQAAKTEVTETIATKDTSGEVVFESGSLGLQALNPEISVTGDFLFSHRQDSTSDESSDFDFRTLGLHIESWLDPYTRLKAAIPVTEDDAKLGEGYITLYNIAEDLNFTLGKFRQQFGVVNRWHKHGLDQVDFPLALRQVFGDGGLNQSGLSLDWMMPPAGKASQQLTFQVTDGSNSRLFADNARSRPSLLSHYKNYRDLSKDTYMEWGLTGLMGWNDEWDISGGVSQNSSQLTTVLGADFSVLWEPAEKMRYRNIEWRSEAYWLNKELLAPDGSGSDTIDAWGFYSYLQSKISRTVDIGIRGDFYVPDTKGYANLSDSLSLSPLAVTRDNAHLWQVSPYITWWQSPFVKFRAEYDYSNGKGIENPEHVIWLQCVFSAGPHKHERY